MEKSHAPVLQPIIYRRRHVFLTSLILVLALLYLWRYDGHLLDPLLTGTQEEPEFHHLASHCSSLEPIQPSEYHARQSALASALHSLKAAAYIAEPGPNAEYFANLSLSQWGLSDRPFLLMISPLESNTSPVQLMPQVTIITPLFESSRAQLLVIPTAGNVKFVPWADDVNPYAVAISSLRESVNMAKDEFSLFVDEDSRYFVAEGIKNAADGIQTQITPPEIRALREQKSPAEIALLRCANEVTLLALRDVQKRMYLGMKESEAKGLILKALADAGLRHSQGWVLFGENAALHGTSNDRELGKEDLALFDIMGSLHGYWSDLTRTIAIKESKIPVDNLEIWHLISAAQAAALRVVKKEVKASEVDEAARDLIRSAGEGNYFTHRLGHGIGIQVHESPYLQGGNDVVLSPGNVFSNEPGIYIEGQVGIRLEDCFVVDDAGLPDLLTGGVGGQAYSPWQP